MTPTSPPCHVILVHHGSSNPTDILVDQLVNNSQSPDTIIISDHADTPYTTNHPLCHVIRPPANDGYGSGINRGLGWLLTHDVGPDDIIICMNNNLTITPTTLAKIRQWWHHHPAPALAAVAVQEDRSQADQGHINLLSGRAHPYHSHPNRLFTLPYLHGACFSAPYHVFMTTNGLVDHYFLYWEDAALSRRAATRGIPLRTISHSGITHRTTKAPHQRRQQLYYLVRNGALFLEHETPAPWRRYWWLTNRARLIYHTIKPRANPIVRQALHDARRGHTGQKNVTP